MFYIPYIFLIYTHQLSHNIRCFNRCMIHLFSPTGNKIMRPLKYDTMRKVWDSQGAGEHLQTKLYDLPHFCSKEIQKAILDFFNKELNVKQK